MARQSRVWLAITALVSVALLIGIAPGVARAASGTTWDPSTVEAPAGGQNPILAATACVAAGECTAVGDYDDDSGAVHLMAVTETGGGWGAPVSIDIPAGGGGPSATLNAVSCVSVGECTAVGYYSDSSGNARAMLVTETGGMWSPAIDVAAPDGAPYPSLDGVSCVSAGECTAVGSYLDSALNSHAMVVTETDGTWGQAAEIGPPVSGRAANLNGVSCVSVGDCTAVGLDFDSSAEEHPMVLTETDGNWHQLTDVGIPDGRASAYLSGVSCVSAGDCTAVGVDSGSDSLAHPMGVTETAGGWGQVVELGVPDDTTTARMNGVSCVSAGGCTAVGYDFDSSDIVHPMVVTEAKGKWGNGLSLAMPDGSTSAPLAGVACVVGSGCTAVGWSLGGGVQEGLVETESVPAAPIVTGISPANGPVNGSTPIAVSGTGFSSPATVRIVQGHGNPTLFATGVTVVSDTEIDATVPAGTVPGPDHVYVHTPGGTSAANAAAVFRYVAPVPAVTAISPDSGPTNSATPIVISGTGFSSPATVRIVQGHGNPTLFATDVTVVSDTEIDANAPAGAVAGRDHVYVHTPGGTSAASAADYYRYTAAAPAIVSISPGSGTAGSPTPVVITGSGFTPDARVTIAQGTGNPSLTATVDSVSGAGGEIDATIPASVAVGTWRVTVHTAAGVSPSTKGDVFAVTAAAAID